MTSCVTVPAGARGEVELRDLEGAPAALALEESVATVVVFWSTGCPCVARYRERIEQLDLAWRERGIQIVAVSSNADDGIERLRASRPSIPLLIDEGGRLARELGARSTPTVVVLDKEGAIRFRGWIDNERRPGEPGREPWLDEALADLVAGRPVARASTPTWGCAITRSFNEARRSR